MVRERHRPLSEAFAAWSNAGEWVTTVWEGLRIEAGVSLPEPPEGVIRHHEDCHRCFLPSAR